MPIRLFSGLPGSGKTLSLVDALISLREKEPHRPIYAHGIDDLKEGLALECDPRDWQSLPDGSIVIVDEAQKVWPQRRAGEVPSEIRALSEHRHRGFDFLLATQQPSYLDAYVRGLVSEHVHVVRRWGGSRVDRYIWQEGVDDTKSTAMRARAQRTKWRYPKRCFDLYKSSTMHTVKRKLPWQYYALPVGIICIVALMWFGLRRGAVASSLAAVSPEAEHASAVDNASRPKVRYATPHDYVVAFLPRVANQPWSAPAFDDAPILAQPDLLCIEHEDDKGNNLCTCYTEQATRYDLHSLRECRTYAEQGVYNPHRPPVGSLERNKRGDVGQGVSPYQQRQQASPTAAVAPALTESRYVQSPMRVPYQSPDAVIASGMR